MRQLPFALISAAVLTLAQPPAAAQERPALAGLKVLIVAPRTAAGPAGSVKKLLERYGARAVNATWQAASPERALEFDLVVVAGGERRIRKADAVLGYGRPVLGLGPYGCGYFGLIQLKNGHPYT